MDFSQLSLPRPAPGFLTHNKPGQNMSSASKPNQSTSGVVSAGASASPTPAVNFNFPHKYQEPSEEVTMRNESDSDSTTNTSFSSEDSQLESVHMSVPTGTLGNFQINNEAVNVIMRIADHAHKRREFNMLDVDLTDIGIETMEHDPNFESNSIIWQSNKELESLKTLVSDSTSDYNSTRSCDSLISDISHGARERYRMSPYDKLKERLEEAKLNKNRDELLKLKREIEVELIDIIKEQEATRNIQKGLHKDN